MRRLKALFKDHAELHALASEAGKHDSLQRLWEEIIPEPLRPHTHAGGIKHRRLTVFAANGAIAARLKLIAPTLLKDLQSKGLEVTSIRVEVQVQSLRRARPISARSLTGNAAESLARFAEQLPESPLRDSLRRLAQRR
ncbi:MAG: DUF721 domain-containing protein [Methylobacillus sp.]|jgi:hypothetical protein|nr:DUF721 domain-containing protein [Methylobacillus sp.]